MLVGGCVLCWTPFSPSVSVTLYNQFIAVKSSRIQRVPHLWGFLHQIRALMVCPPSRCNICMCISMRLCYYWIIIFQRDCSCRSLLLGFVAMPTVLIVIKKTKCVGSPCFEIRLLLALPNVSAHSFSVWSCPLRLPILKPALPWKGPWRHIMEFLSMERTLPQQWSP